MKHDVLEEQDDLFIVQTDGHISTLPRNDYFILKLHHFDGNRIFYDFGKNGARIEETYDDGIFNCYHDESLVQIADGESIARAILDKNYDAFFSLFARWFGIKQQEKILCTIFRQYGQRVRQDKSSGMYIIDDIFGVNEHGVGRYCTEDGKWKNMCIVVRQSVKPREINMPGIGPVLLNEITQTILAKVLFLLFPTRDIVFLNQLSPTAKAHAMHLIGRNEITGR